jgi:hypothetical protein
VEKAGYIKEYVWSASTADVPEAQQPANRGFDSWAQENIPGHQVLTVGSISIRQKL